MSDYWQLFQMAERIGSQTSALLETIGERITTMKLPSLKKAEYAYWDEAKSESGWLYTQEWQQYRIKKARDKKANYSLVLQAVLFSDCKLVTEETSMLIVSFYYDPDEESADTYFSEPYLRVGDPDYWQGDECRFENRLVSPKGSVAFNDSSDWAFALPLAGFDSPQAIDNKLMPILEHLFSENGFQHPELEDALAKANALQITLPN